MTRWIATALVTALFACLVTACAANPTPHPHGPEVYTGGHPDTTQAANDPTGAPTTAVDVDMTPGEFDHLDGVDGAAPPMPPGCDGGRVGDGHSSDADGSASNAASQGDSGPADSGAGDSGPQPDAGGDSDADDCHEDQALREPGLARNTCRPAARS